MSLAYSDARRGGSRRINYEQTVARVPIGTLSRIDAVLGPSERQAEFLRVAIEAELNRREAKVDRT